MRTSQDPNVTPWSPRRRLLLAAVVVTGLVGFARLDRAIAQDGDGDGVSDADDNCPGLFNPEQRDRDGDGLGNLCDCEDSAYRLQIGAPGDILEVVLGAGDLDGDGHPDAIVGSGRGLEDDDPACPGARSWVRAYSVLRGELLFAFASGEGCDGLGASLAALDDVDGDGRPDLLAGAPRGGGRGRVYVISGATGQALLEAPGGSFHLQGQSAGDEFGASVAALGDLNGDGKVDFAVGAPGRQAQLPGTGQGRVYVLRGGDCGSLGACTLFTLDGESPAEAFGSSVAGIGDFNGDSVRDIALAARPLDPSHHGRIQVRSGADGSLLYELAGQSRPDLLGATVAPLGDVNGDGRADLLVGASQLASNASLGPGKAMVILGGVAAGPGPAPSLLRTHLGTAVGDALGASISRIGDVDQDGHPDYAVGSPGFRRASGAPSGRVVLYSGATGARIFDLGGSMLRRRLGATIAATGGPAGDGSPVLLAAEASPRPSVHLFPLGDSDLNGRRDSCEPCKAATSLRPGVDGSASQGVLLSAFKSGACIPIEFEAGLSARIRVEDLGTRDSVALYFQWGTPPDSSHHDASAVDRFDPAPEIWLPRTRATTGYLVLDARALEDGAAAVQVIVQASSRARLRRVSPRAAAVVPLATGRSSFTLRILGAGLKSGVGFALRRSGGGPATERVAHDVILIDSQTAEATFDLAGAPAGAYNVVALQGGQEDVLEGAFQLLAGRGSRLAIGLRGPPIYRELDGAALTLHIVNSGDIPMLAPILRVRALDDTSQRTRFRLEPGAPAAPEIYLLGTSPNGQAGQLGPGEEGEFEVLFRSDSLCDPGMPCPIEFEVAALTVRQDDYVPWTELENPDPSSIPPALWRGALARLSAELGPTWSTFQERLAGAASRLRRRGESDRSLGSLFGFVFKSALGRPVSAITGEARLGDGTPATAVIIALSDGESVAMSPLKSDGSFTLEGLVAGRPYTLLLRGHAIVKEDGGRGAASNGRLAVSLPEAGSPSEGDLLGLSLVVEPRPGMDAPNPPPGADPGLPLYSIQPPDGLFTPKATWKMRVVRSIDPNEKDGEVGGGGDLIPSGGPTQGSAPPSIQYKISFENCRCARAAAASVTVIDTLDATKLDIASLRLETVSVGGDQESKLLSLDEADRSGWSLSDAVSGVEVAVLPPNRTLPAECTDDPSCASEDFPTCEANEGEVGNGGQATTYANIGDIEVRAELTPVRGGEAISEYELTVTIESCGDSGSSCDEFGFPVGFLPPNDCSTHQGEGYVTLRINALPALDPNEEIRNSAQIVFDENILDAITVEASVIVNPTTPPAPATSPSPPDATGEPSPRIVSVDEPLSWEPPLYADGYRLSVWELDPAGARIATLLDEVELSEPFYAPLSQEPPAPPWRSGTQHEWRVTPFNEHGETPAPPAWRFLIEGPPPDPPGAPVLEGPAPGDTVSASSARLRWRAPDAGGPVGTYAVYLWTDGEAAPPGPTAYVGTGLEQELLELEAGARYRWRVDSINAGGSASSQESDFLTGEGIFQRGDTNADGQRNISDPISLLGYLFLGTEAPPCASAADADDSGKLDLTDAVAILTFLFLGGAPLPEPSTCGPDPTPDLNLDCATFSPCRG